MQRYVDEYKQHTARGVAQGFKPMSFPRFVQLAIKLDCENCGITAK